MEGGYTTSFLGEEGLTSLLQTYAEPFSPGDSIIYPTSGSDEGSCQQPTSPTTSTWPILDDPMSLFFDGPSSQITDPSSPLTFPTQELDLAAHTMSLLGDTFGPASPELGAQIPGEPTHINPQSVSSTSPKQSTPSSLPDIDPNDPLKCQVCGKSLTRAWDLRRHMKLHTNTRAYVCDHPGCTRSFVQKSALKVHTRVHTGERPHECMFPGCGKAFGDSSAMARHRRLHDADPMPFKCPWEGGACRGAFGRKEGLIAHMKHHDPTWQPPPGFAKNWVSNALPKKKKGRSRRRRKDDTSSDEEDDDDEDESPEPSQLPAMFATAVSLQGEKGRQLANTAKTSKTSAIVVAQSLAGALTASTTKHKSPSSSDAIEGVDEAMAQLLQEELGDEDDGLLGIELRPRGPIKA